MIEGGRTEVQELELEPSRMASYKNVMGEYFMEKEGPLLGVGLKRRARGRRLKNQETRRRGI